MLVKPQSKGWVRGGTMGLARGLDTGRQVTEEPMENVWPGEVQEKPDCRCNAQVYKGLSLEGRKTELSPLLHEYVQ